MRNRCCAGDNGEGLGPLLSNMVWTAISLLFGVNALTIALFWFDKRRAVAGDRRVPEADLLLLALLGGTPGALFARRVFRHKTRKEPFSTMLLLICVAQIGTIIGLVVT